MKRISTLSYLVVEASDLATWKSFAERLGFQVVESNAQELHLRMDQQSYRMIVSEGNLDDLKALGWAFPNKESLSAYVVQLQQQGLNIQQADESLLAQRHAEALFILQDLNGIQHEFATGLTSGVNAFKSPLLNSKFLTDEGFGHVLVTTQDKAGSLDFYQRIGLSITEEIAPGIVIDATFMHVNQRHHSFTFAPMPPEMKRLHHLMVEVSAVDDVGLAYDRCNEAKDPMAMTLGKHPNDEMFSFYVQSPSGFAIEVGHGGKLIDYQNWETESFSKLSSWGHKQHRA